MQKPENVTDSSVQHVRISVEKKKNKEMYENGQQNVEKQQFGHYDVCVLCCRDIY